MATALASKSELMPPTFDQIGKAAADFFKDKFDYKSQVRLRHRASKRLTLTSAGGASDRGVFGSMHAKFRASPTTIVETEMDAASAEAKVAVRTQVALADAARLGAAAAFQSHPRREGIFAWSTEPAISAHVDYQQQYSAWTAGIDTSLFDVHLARLASVVGHGGLSVGCQMQFDAARLREQTDWALAAELDLGQGATVNCRTDADHAALSYLHKLSAAQTVAAAVSVLTPLDASAPAPALAFGIERRVDETTQLKAKGALQLTRDGGVTANGSSVAGVIEHRLTNPSLLFALSASYQPQSGFRRLCVENVGVSLTFGDFDD